MISVPNVHIELRAQDNKSSSHQRPIWFAEMFRAVWGANLDPEHGCVVTPVPECTPDSLRYSVFPSFEAAELATVNYFSPTNTDGSFDRNRRQQVIQIFKTKFPSGLKAIIQEEIEKDARRALASLAKEKAKVKPDASFLEANITDLTEDMILSMHDKGYANLLECAEASAVKLTTECGLTPAIAVRVIAAAQALRAANRIPMTPIDPKPEQKVVQANQTFPKK